MDGNGGMGHGIIIDSSYGSFPEIPYVKRTSKIIMYDQEFKYIITSFCGMIY